MPRNGRVRTLTYLEDEDADADADAAAIAAAIDRRITSCRYDQPT